MDNLEGYYCYFKRWWSLSPVRTSVSRLMRQMADAIWWVKTYQKDKDHLIVMKMAMLVKSRTDIGIDP